MSSNFQDTFTKNDSTDSLQYDEIAFYFYSSAILSLTLIPLLINFLKQYRNLTKVNKQKLATCQCYYCNKKIHQLKNNKKKPASLYVKGTLIVVLFLFLGISLKICMQRKDLKTFDPYEILGVEINSDDTTIKKAFKKMAREYHPDKNPGDPDAHQKFILVNKAYQCLENEESRQNCLESGNPEGAKGSYEVGIAMPTFLLKKENKLVVLSLFFIFILFILPALALYFYTSSDQLDAYGTEKSLVYRVLGFYKNEHVQFKNFLQLISTSKDLAHLLSVKPNQVNALKKLAVPEIVQGLNKNFQPFLKPYVLLNAYMMGEQIDPVLQKDFQEILKRTINILNSLVDLSVEFHNSSRFIKQVIGKEVKFDFVQKVIQFCQLFYQGIIMHDSDMLQLAGVTKHNIDLINKKFKKKTVKQLLQSEEDQQKLFKLLKIDKLVEETKQCMKAFPQWRISCENYVQISDDIKDNVIREGDLFTVKITINSDNKVGYIHSKNFPFLKQEILHLFVFFSRTQKLIFHKKIVNKNEKIEETFNAYAQTKDSQEFVIYLMSDSYINFDEKLTHTVEILPKENQEEFKVHPDDIEALQKGSLYQNMMKELQMEADSDDEEEEEVEQKKNSDQEEEEEEEEEMIKEEKEIDNTQEEMTHEDIIKDIKENN